MTQAYDRLQEFAVKHLVAVLRHLKGGSIGFDPARDDRTSTKDAFVSFLRSNWSPEQINAAHEAVKANYAGGDNYRGRYRGKRGGDIKINGGQEAQANGENGGDQQESNVAEMSIDEIAKELQDDGNGQQKDAAEQSDDYKEDKADAEKILEQVRQILEGKKKGKGDKEAGKQEKKRGGNANKLQHKSFDELLIACQATDHDGNRLNVWLHGPAGTGKTTAAKHVSQALNLPFFFNSALDTGYKLTGFVDANGRLVRTPFRDAWERGGVYLFDECDGSAPSALIEFNAALANGAHAFPDGIIPRHKDCVIIAGANTVGLGGTSEYVGRAKQDAAFMDRFVLIDWPIDEALELAICPNKDWCKHVQRIRANVKKRGVRGVTITPRASVYGASLLAAGLPMPKVEAMTLKKGMTADQWQQVIAA